MVMSNDIEDIEVMKHRFEGFEQEMNANASRVAVVNQLARQLLHVEHPNSEEILAQQNHLNERLVVCIGSKKKNHFLIVTIVHSCYHAITKIK